MRARGSYGVCRGWVAPDAATRVPVAAARTWQTPLAAATGDLADGASHRSSRYLDEDIPCQMPEAQTSVPRGVRDAPHRWPLPYRSAQALTRRRGLGRSRGSDYNGACRHWGRFAHCPLYERHPPAESVRDPPTCPVICTPHPLGVSPCRSPTCRGRPRPACRRPPPAGRPRYVSTRPRSPGRGRDRSPRREPARAAAPGCGPAATAARHRRAGPA
jgi:hypothetical protein